MQFDGTFARGDRSFPVSGTIDRFVQGADGTLTYHPIDVAIIPPGSATLAVEGHGTWRIYVNRLHYTSGGPSESGFLINGLAS